MLILAMAVLLVPLGLVGLEVRTSRAAATAGIRALCERENITDTQTRECMIKMKLMEEQVAQR
jgi:hypothetical protein